MRTWVSCPVCESGDSAPVRDLRDPISGEDFGLHRCHGCEALYIKDPPPVQELARYYENPAGDRMRRPPAGFFSFFRRFLLARDMRFLLSRLQRGSKITDLGCGDGAVCAYLSARGYGAKGVDYYPGTSWGVDGAGYAQADLNRPQEVAAAASHGPSPAVPDAVVLRHVFEHLTRPRALLEVLGETGVRYVQIVVPNADSRLRRFFGASWAYWDPPRHLTYFSPATLGRIAAKCGFRIVHRQSYGLDEVFVSLNRWASLRRRRWATAALARLTDPKGPLVTLSCALSGLSTRILNTVCLVVLENERSAGGALSNSASAAGTGTSTRPPRAR